jgi:uncharacterized protein YjbI with pentapeptide repeats
MRVSDMDRGPPSMTDISNDRNSYLGIHFKALDLAGQTLTGLEFEDCSFVSCNFSETKFVKCKFLECTFRSCNLSVISVAGCSFGDVSFEESKVIGVNWTQANWPRIRLNSPFRFDKSILDNCSFYGLGLKGLAMVECKAREADFRHADCSEANFTHTDFAGSMFGSTNLSRADFSEARNYNIDISNNVIKKARFTWPDAMNLLRHLDIEIGD